MPKPAVLRVVGGNVRNNPPMRRRQVLHDYRLMRDLGDVLLLNEVGRRSYRRWLRRVLLPMLWGIAALWRSETPVAWRKKTWKKVRVEVHRMHEGRAGASPVRRVVVVLLQHRVTGVVVAFVCSHRVSGAWNAKPKKFKAWRRRVWLEHDEGEEIVIDSLVALGFAVIRFADFNKVHVDKADPRERWLLGRGRIVKMSMIEPPGGPDLRLVEAHERNDVETDHPILAATVAVTEPVRTAV